MTTRVWLSGVSSTTHLVHVGSWLRHLLAAEPDVVLVDLGATTFLGAQRVGQQDVAVHLPEGLARGTGLGARRGERLVYLAVGAPGIKPLLRLSAAHPGRPVHVVVVDEGLGSYGDWRSRRAALERQGGGTRALVRAVAVATAARLFCDERWALYEHDQQGWHVHAAAAAGFALRPDVPTDRRTAVFLSQPWVELGQVEARRWNALLLDAAQACSDAGLVMRVRPHPAEDRDHLAGLVVDEGRGPAELDPAVVGAGLVLGVNSTALLNLAAVHRTPAVRVEVPELHEVERTTSRAQAALLRTYLDDPVPVSLLTAAARRLAR